MPGIVQFQGADGVPIYTNLPDQTAAEMASNGGRLRAGVTSVPSVVPPPGVAMSEATGVTPSVGQRTQPAEGFTPADRMTQLAMMAMRSQNFAAERAGERNNRLVGDARNAAQAGRTGEASQLIQLAQAAGQQSPQRGGVGLPPGVALGAIDKDARFADRARVAAELRGADLQNQGTALANQGTAAQNRANELVQQQAEEQAALIADLLSGDEERRNAAAEKLARFNAVNAKPEKPLTADVTGEHGADQYIVDPRTGQTVFDPAKARAVAQARAQIAEALADGDEQAAAKISEQLRRTYGVDLQIGGGS